MLLLEAGGITVKSYNSSLVSTFDEKQHDLAKENYFLARRLLDRFKTRVEENISNKYRTYTFLTHHKSTTRLVAYPCCVGIYRMRTVRLSGPAAHLVQRRNA